MNEYLVELLSRGNLSEDLRQMIYTQMIHAVNVSTLSRNLAKELEMDETFCHNIEIAGLLHDVGKIPLNRHLFQEKKGHQNIEQMRYVRLHPLVGRESLEKSHYPREICEAVYCHHENLDGSGYPEGLRGEQIPVMAKIIRTCDVYCALISDRSYRKAFDRETALGVMIDEVENYDMTIFLALQRLVHRDDASQDEELQTITQNQKDHLPFFLREVQHLDAYL